MNPRHGCARHTLRHYKRSVCTGGKHLTPGRRPQVSRRIVNHKPSTINSKPPAQFPLAFPRLVPTIRLWIRKLPCSLRRNRLGWDRGMTKESSIGDIIMKSKKKKDFRVERCEAPTINPELPSSATDVENPPASVADAASADPAKVIVNDLSYSPGVSHGR
jgi:hypothetical protein